jgi:hypothetical protein
MTSDAQIGTVRKENHDISANPAKITNTYLPISVITSGIYEWSSPCTINDILSETQGSAKKPREVRRKELQVGNIISSKCEGV